MSATMSKTEVGQVVDLLEKARNAAADAGAMLDDVMFTCDEHTKSDTPTVEDARNLVGLAYMVQRDADALVRASGRAIEAVARLTYLAEEKEEAS